MKISGISLLAVQILFVVCYSIDVAAVKHERSHPHNATHPAVNNPASQTAAVPAPTSCVKMTKVLVTGISGMIGSHVAKVLVAKPCHIVYGLVRPRSNLDSLTSFLSKVQLVVGDITDPFRMLDVLRDVQPHYLYHFAAQAINSISYQNPHLTTDVNVQGTMNLLESLRRNNLTKCRLIFAGSSTEYGRTTDLYKVPIPENAPLDPVSPYGASKVAGEKLITQYHLSYGQEAVIARFFIQVGTGGTATLAIQDFSRQVALIEAGIQTPAVLKHGNLESLRDMTDVRDSAPVVVKLGELGVSGESYNIGTGTAMSIQALLDLLLTQSKVKITSQLEESRLRVYDEAKLECDNKKIKDLTGWKPSVNMTDTVGEILAYWRRNVQYLYGDEIRVAAAAQGKQGGKRRE